MDEELKRAYRVMSGVTSRYPSISEARERFDKPLREEGEPVVKGLKPKDMTAKNSPISAKVEVPGAGTIEVTIGPSGAISTTSKKKVPPAANSAAVKAFKAALEKSQYASWLKKSGDE